MTAKEEETVKPEQVAIQQTPAPKPAELRPEKETQLYVSLTEDKLKEVKFHEPVVKAALQIRNN